VLVVLATIAARRGDDARAENLGREAMKIGTTHGYATLIAGATMVVGGVALRRGALAEAAAFYASALTIAQTASLAMGADAAVGIAAVAHAAGRTREAARLLAGAAALRERLRTSIVPAERAAYEGLVDAVRTALGHSAFTTEWTIGQTLAAAKLLEQARAVHSELGLPPG
jgi:hypothetical protein